MKTGSARWRPLLALTSAVLAAHLLLLRGSPSALQAPQAVSHWSMVTREIAAAPPADPTPAVLLQASANPDPAAARAPVKKRRPTAAAVQTAEYATATSEPAPVAVPVAFPVAVPVSTPPTPTVRAPASGAPVLAVKVPAPVRLHYKVEARARNFTLQGDGELQWRHDGKKYEAQLELSTPLLPRRSQHSTGAITTDGLEPLRFSDKARSEEAAHFERDRGAVSFSSNRPDAALAAGAQDRLSVMLQLGALIAGAPAKFPPGSTIAIQTASTRDAEQWLFTVEGEEQLQLPGGHLGALKLTRNPRKEFDQKVELWLAPTMDYLPVRLRLTQPNGDWVDQQWSSTDKG